MTVKFKQVYDLMITQNQATFDSFKLLHDKYVLEPDKFREEFNREGYDIQDLIRRYENILCSNSENGGFGKFSANLAEKFQAEVKKNFPKIDHVGLE